VCGCDLEGSVGEGKNKGEGERGGGA